MFHHCNFFSRFDLTNFFIPRIFTKCYSILSPMRIGFMHVGNYEDWFYVDNYEDWFYVDNYED
jgi:hypothetical protein